MSRSVVIGARGSKLALVQARAVAAALAVAEPGLSVRVEAVSSAGDDQPDAPLASLGRGAFTSALERALLDGRIAMAVHSLKDLPTSQPDGLAAVAVLEREDARDVLVNRWGARLIDLPAGARVGTSSPRRAGQLAHGRKDIVVSPIRGNVETRIAKSEGPDYDGVVIAAAGVNRLGMADRVAEFLSPRVCAPAPGQGALAVEARSDDSDALALARRLVHPPTAAAVEAERELLRAAGSGCALPIGAFAETHGDEMRLFACAAPADGSASCRVEVTGNSSDPEILGRAAYRALLEQGLDALLEASE